MSNPVEISESSLTLHAFRENAVKSVVLVDEQFPTILDALVVDSNTEVAATKSDVSTLFPQWELARNLYGVFQTKDLVCDIVNDPDLLSGKLPRKLTESDLIVLDLQLREGDPSISIEILKQLADNAKFNLVVVYTAQENLSDISRQIAGSLRGKPPLGEEDDDIAAELATINSKLDEYGCPRNHLADSFISNKCPSGKDFGLFRKQVYQNHDIDRKKRGLLLDLVAAFVLENDYKAIIDDNLRRHIDVGDSEAENPWLVLANLFIVIVSKKHTAPSDVISVLDRTITEWRPGLVRTLVAEIQNTLSRHRYSFTTSFTDDIETQIGWLWHATFLSDDEIHEFPPVPRLMNRLLNTLSICINEDSQMTQFADECLKLVHRYSDANAQLSEVVECCGMGATSFDLGDIIHAINCFDSNIPFSGNFITAGTVLVSNEDGEGPMWWVCIEPACEMTPSQSQEPLLRCRLLELENCTYEMQAALSNASKSKHLFVRNDGERIVLASEQGRESRGRIPVVKTAYIEREDQIKTRDDGRYEATAHFPSKKVSPPAFITRKMVVVGQLREPHANRLMQDSGSHLSRIGLDFVDLPEQVDAETNESEGN